MRAAPRLPQVTGDAKAQHGTATSRLLQKKCACGARAKSAGGCSACQRQARRPAVSPGNGNAVPAEVSAVIGAAGRPLQEATQARMRKHFGHDFSRVRVHDDAPARRSAGMVGARAYTVGEHVVFGPGTAQPESTASRTLLAHELAHVVQQGGAGGGTGPVAGLEAEADRAAAALDAGVPAPVMSAAPTMMARDDGESADAGSDASFEATLAEATCDLATLCRLSFTAPDVVDTARVVSAWRSCNPTASTIGLVGGNPCWSPNFGLPAPQVGGSSAPGPAAAPQVGPAPPAASPSAGSGLALPSTTVEFDMGPVHTTIDLPASLALQLPVDFRGGRITFRLEASPSNFLFRITIDGIPHVRIILNASSTPAGEAAAGLTVQTTRTVCRATDAATARSSLESAGNRLRDAIDAVQNPPAPDPEASELEQTFAPHMRLADVVSAVANVHSTVERVQAACREVPVASFDFGVQGPLSAPDPGDEDAPGTFVGGGIRLHF